MWIPTSGLENDVMLEVHDTRTGTWAETDTLTPGSEIRLTVTLTDPDDRASTLAFSVGVIEKHDENGTNVKVVPDATLAYTYDGTDKTWTAVFTVADLDPKWKAGGIGIFARLPDGAVGYARRVKIRRP